MRSTLPLRLWLILVVMAIIGATAVVEAAVAAAIYHADGQTGWHAAGQGDQAQIASVRRIIGSDPAQWQQAGWQRRTTAALGALGVDVALFASGPGHLTFATPGARRFMDTALPATTGRPAGAGSGNAQLATSSSTALPSFDRITITGPAQPPGARRPLGIALLWFTQTAAGDFWIVLFPVAGVLALALSLGIIAWLIRRPVLRPLAAMSEAAASIAGGDLDVRLPSSPVREISEVTVALEGMSGALRGALARQSALEEERRLFVGAIVHDLRTPLFILRAHLRGLQRGIAATPEKVREYVDECAAKADALERLIADLFAFTRLEYLGQDPERAPLELGALLCQTIEGVQPLATAKGSTVALDGSADPHLLLGDSHMLARVIENLLDNAIRHTPSGGQIRVYWGREGDCLRFAVADSGPGIPAHDLPHLFTPLYRGETSRNRQTGGAGLGLAIARRILRAHGGDLTAANGRAGGAVFTATLPAMRQASSPAIPVTTSLRA